MHTDPQPVDTIVLLFQQFQTEIETDPNIQTLEVQQDTEFSILCEMWVELLE
jgi:hypothetical protein